MAYYCQDCSYTGNKRSADGKCPACGSPDFRIAGAKAKAEKAETRKGSLLLVILLWGYLIGHIYWKLYG